VAAQALFEQAKKLMAERRAAEACPKLEESQRLDPGSGTLLNLARCYEQVGRLSSAWNGYLEAASAARASGNGQREKEARKRADALRPRVSNLVVMVTPEVASAEGLEISRDGQPIGKAQWGAAIPADEGEHAVAAAAPGHARWQTVVVVKGEGTTTTVVVPGLTHEAAAPPLPVSTAPVAPPPAKDEPPASGLGMQRTLALVAGGVGVVGLGVGTIFALKSLSNHDEASKYCNGADCTDPRGISAGNDAYGAGNVATVGMIIGAAGLAGGLALWFTAPSARNGGAEARLLVGPGSVHVNGVW
jgi:tetratricopeptide (TPR) repeat protein